MKKVCCFQFPVNKVLLVSKTNIIDILCRSCIQVVLLSSCPCRSWGRTSGLLISYQTQTKSQVCKIGYNLPSCHHHSHGSRGSRAEHTEHRSHINFVSSGACDHSLFSASSAAQCTTRYYVDCRYMISAQLGEQKLNCSLRDTERQGSSL